MEEYILFNGYIDELRISKGIARWAADFTPPTSEYTGGWGGKVLGVSSPAKVLGVSSIAKVNGV